MSNQQMLTVLSGEIMAPAIRQQFDQSRVDDAIAFEREAGFAMQVLQGNDYLQKIAMGNLPSLRAAVVNLAAIGISLNPAKKQAYLVPREGKVCLDISYMGLLDLATESGSVLWGQANVVRDCDAFALNGVDKPPSHTFDPFASDRHTRQIVGAYCTIKTADGDYLTHTMSIAEIYAIRDRSAAWKSGKKCPWHTDEGEMCKKTVVKQASKYWPKNERVQRAAHYLNEEGGEGLAERDMGAADVVVPTVNTAAILEEIDKANDFAALNARRAEWNAACLQAKDAEAWKTIKGALTVRLGELKPQEVEQ